MEQIFCVFERSTGRAVSFGTVLADPMPVGLDTVAVAQMPDKQMMWDEATRTLVPRPQTDNAQVIAERIANDMPLTTDPLTKQEIVRQARKHLRTIIGFE
jgi:hypothetical protein